MIRERGQNRASSIDGGRMSTDRLLVQVGDKKRSTVKQTKKSAGKVVFRKFYDPIPLKDVHKSPDEMKVFSLGKKEQELSEHLFRFIEAKRNAIDRTELNRLNDTKRSGIKQKFKEAYQHMERMNSSKLTE